MVPTPVFTNMYGFSWARRGEEVDSGSRQWMRPPTRALGSQAATPTQEPRE